MKPMKRKPENHTPDEALYDLVDGRAEPGLIRSAIGHIEACSRCRKRFEDIRSFREKLNGSNLESPPEWLHHWAGDLPRSHPRHVPKPVRSILRLVFDSLSFEPAGVRGRATRPRRLVFQQGTVDIDIEVEVRPGGSLNLRGQILDSSVPGGRTFVDGEVQLRSGRTVTSRAALSEQGQFLLPHVEPEVYSLRIEARGFDCRIPSIEV